eukprot:g502.t1
MTELFADRALLPDGWAADVMLRWDGAGRLIEVTPDAGAIANGTPRAPGPVVPGMTNLHSHSFQRAMAGRAETRGDPARTGGDESFWTWREAMYRLALRLEPDDAAVIARHLAVECLVRGYTGICEFHYLHRDPKGAAYDDPATMSLAVVSGLREAGIAVTHLPVLYSRGGFDDAPLDPRQMRFKGSPKSMLAVVERVRDAFAGDPGVRVGLAPHSVRAAPPKAIAEAVRALAKLDETAPIHIHIAEQEKEVADCLAATGHRPVTLLSETVGIDARWCLVHATHLDAAEIALMAQSGAVAGLCPMTEANLGDGLFPITAYLEAGGRLGVGSDSHVSRDPTRELALLEYGVRLIEKRRNRLASPESPSVGGTLWPLAAAGGGQAAGRKTGRIEVGAAADLVALDREHPDIAERQGDQVLDGWLFAADSNPVEDVYVGGVRVVAESHHAHQVEARTAYRRLLARLYQD